MIYKQIQYFLRSAEYQNFSKAAQELYIAPQAVAKQISLLEADLGAPLFDRVGKKLF